MENLEKILGDFNAKISAVKNRLELEEIRVSFLGKKSALNDFFSQLKDLSVEEKKVAGSQINKVREVITKKIDDSITGASSNRKASFTNINPSKAINPLAVNNFPPSLCVLAHTFSLSSVHGVRIPIK